MSWFLSTSGKSNADLINNLARHHIVKTAFIKEVMLKVDCKNFLKLSHTFNEAYSDVPLPLNESVTISAPHMHATALEYLAEQLEKPNCKCLDVGSGSGYLVSCMLNAILMKNGNQIEDRVRVAGIEYLEEIAEFSKQALKKDLERRYGPEIH
jgi:protein-L-isoaspartate(D-aspartate) O-methyltransferase